MSTDQRTGPFWFVVVVIFWLAVVVGGSAVAYDHLTGDGDDEVDSPPGHLLILPMHEESANRIHLQFDLASGNIPHCSTILAFLWAEVLDPSVIFDTVPVFCYVPPEA